MKWIISTLLSCILLFTGCVGSDSLQNITVKEPVLSSYDITMRRDLLTLMLAYPEDILTVEKEDSGKVFIVMKSGKKLLYDDKAKKSQGEKVANPDLQDMLEQIYPLTAIQGLMDEAFDPGRVRVYPLLKEVYGGTEEQIKKNLVPVKAGYKNYSFNQRNGAAEALGAVMKELVPLAEKRRDVYACVFPASGTFNYRLIAGTNRLSPHAFGTAIDLASDKRDYWQWASREDGEKRIAAYPKEIPQIFEKHNFIWGGKWGHFDILHYEYRPELIIKAKYFKDLPQAGKPWYDGIPSLDEGMEQKIKIIDEALK